MRVNKIQISMLDLKIFKYVLIHKDLICTSQILDQIYFYCGKNGIISKYNLLCDNECLDAHGGNKLCKTITVCTTINSGRKTKTSEDLILSGKGDTLKTRPIYHKGMLLSQQSNWFIAVTP